MVDTVPSPAVTGAGVQSVDRALGILEVLARTGGSLTLLSTDGKVLATRTEPAIVQKCGSASGMSTAPERIA